MARRCHSLEELRAALSAWAQKRLGPRTEKEVGRLASIYGVRKSVQEVARTMFKEADRARLQTIDSGRFATAVRTLVERAEKLYFEPGEPSGSLDASAWILAGHLLRLRDEAELAWLWRDDPSVWRDSKVASGQPSNWRVISATRHLFARAMFFGQPGPLPQRADYVAVHILVGQPIPDAWTKARGITVHEALDLLKDRYKQALRHLRHQGPRVIQPGEPAFRG